MIKNLPGKLQTLRIENGYSQKCVAQKLGISPSVVSAYETGERTPSTDILLAISYLYNCSTDYLLGRQAADPKYILNAEGLTDNQISAIRNLIASIR